MKREPSIHRQRLILVVGATIAMLGCFVPAGRVPMVWTVEGILLMRKYALWLAAASIAPAVIGRWGKPMPQSLKIPGFLAVGVLFVFCIFRLADLGQRSIPNFADDDPRARPYYEKACDAGVMEGCTLLGACYWTGTCGVNRDMHRGLTLYKQACDGGDMSACGQLGMCYEVGGCGLAQNGQQAIAYYEKACAGGEMGMCNNLGVCYHKGKCGVSRDDVRAAELYRQACKGGDSGACHNLDLIGN